MVQECLEELQLLCGPYNADGPGTFGPEKLIVFRFRRHLATFMGINEVLPLTLYLGPPTTSTVFTQMIEVLCHQPSSN